MCENLEELKKYRTDISQDARTKLAANIRRKAEESYRNNNIEEAFRYFWESYEKNNADFCTTYQLALIYFFERADYKNALEFFKQTKQLAATTIPQLVINSLVFIGLILRLIGKLTQNQEMMNEAYQTTSIAYFNNIECFFSKYALIQCSFLTPPQNSYADATNLMAELIKKEKIYALQILYEYLFNSYIGPCKSTLENIISEFSVSAKDVFKKIEAYVDDLALHNKYLTIPAKLVTVKNDFGKVVNQFGNNTLFDILTASQQAGEILKTCEALIKEVKENKVFFEIRDYIMGLIGKYNEDLKIINEDLNGVISQKDELKARLDKLFNTYPGASAQQVIEKYNEQTKSYEQELLPSTPGWENMPIFVVVKAVTGCMAFVLVFVFIIIYSLVFSGGISGMTFLSGGVALLFLPVYSLILGEIYYYYIESCKKSIQEEIKKLNTMIEELRNKNETAVANLRSKFINVIAEHMKLPIFNAEQIFNAACENNFEKVKNFLPK